MKLPVLGILFGLFLFPAVSASVPTKARVDGLWEGWIIYAPAQTELDVTVEIADSLVGTIDFPVMGLQFHPLQTVKVEGEEVVIRFDRFPDKEGAEDQFELQGALSADGRKLAGRFKGRQGSTDLDLPFELDRKADAGSERPAVVKSPLTVLSEDGAALRLAFNRDQDKVRLVLFLSPSCGTCLSTARVIERYVLDKIEDGRLRVYAVWGPMLGPEKEENAREATVRMVDPRVTHFWTGGGRLAEDFGKALKRADVDSGWNTYQIFPVGVTWQDSVPVAARFMYLDKPLPADLALNGNLLAAWVRGYLEAGEAPSNPRR